MIQTFVDRWEQNKHIAEDEFRREAPQSYTAVVKAAVLAIKGDAYDEHNLDPERIHVIDDGHYQGTLLFVIGAEGYQPSTYHAVAVSYGSCSGCDTLEAIRGYSDEPATDDQIAQYMTLAMHIVQGMRQISGYDMLA
ncbi:MAG TPA: hypothetical protein VLA89_02825 [Gemmatimonadales bacterium]|nr:hypothetical protein [Gemmatimonadales bacterium]